MFSSATLPAEPVQLYVETGKKTKTMSTPVDLWLVQLAEVQNDHNNVEQTVFEWLWTWQLLTSKHQQAPPLDSSLLSTDEIVQVTFRLISAKKKNVVMLWCCWSYSHHFPPWSCNRVGKELNWEVDGGECCTLKVTFHRAEAKQTKKTMGHGSEILLHNWHERPMFWCPEDAWISPRRQTFLFFRRRPLLWIALA